MNHAAFGFPWSVAPLLRLVWAAEFSSGIRAMQELRTPNPYTICWYIKKGRRKVIIDQTEYELDEGDMAIFAPQTERIDLDIVKDTTYLVLSCDAKIGGIDIALLYQFPAVIRKQQLEQAAPLIEVWEQLLAQLVRLHRGEPRSGLRIQSMPLTDALFIGKLTEQWFDELVKLLTPQLQSLHTNVDRRVFQACKFMEKNIDQKLTVQHIAEHCKISPSHLQMLFRQMLRMSPKQYANHIRFLMASELLLQGSVSVEEVAGRIGYEDPQEFRRWFKRRSGLSVRTYCLRGAQALTE